MVLPLEDNITHCTAYVVSFNEEEQDDYSDMRSVSDLKTKDQRRSQWIRVILESLGRLHIILDFGAMRHDACSCCLHVLLLCRS